MPISIVATASSDKLHTLMQTSKPLAGGAGYTFLIAATVVQRPSGVRSPNHLSLTAL